MCPAAHCPYCLRGLHMSDCPLPSLSEGPSHVWLPTALTAWGAFIPHVWLPTALTAWGDFTCPAAHCLRCLRGLHVSSCPLLPSQLSILSLTALTACLKGRRRAVQNALIIERDIYLQPSTPLTVTYVPQQYSIHWPPGMPSCSLCLLWAWLPMMQILFWHVNPLLHRILLCT